MKTKFTLKPKKRHTSKQYFRKYIGGPLDGRNETVPLFPKATLKVEIDKPFWFSVAMGMTPKSNIYRLQEPLTQPKNGATYIYEYQP